MPKLYTIFFNKNLGMSQRFIKISFIKKSPERRGFSLAEVLVTLGIIGVVAGLTIPQLMNNVDVEEYRVKLKKEYSAVSQAINLLQAENGSIDTSSVTNLANELGSKLQVSKQGTLSSIANYPASFNYKCYKETSGTCGNYIVMPSMGGFYGLRMNDGALIVINWSSSDCSGLNYHTKISDSDVLPIANTCATIQIDLNGEKKPNMFGVDYHFFYLLKRNNQYYFLPAGAKSNPTYCAKGSPDNYNPSLHCTSRMLLDVPMP